MICSPTGRPLLVRPQGREREGPQLCEFVVRKITPSEAGESNRVRSAPFIHISVCERVYVSQSTHVRVTTEETRSQSV